MKTINATEAARRFSDMLNQVSYQGVSFEIIRGNKPVALLSPVAAPSPVRVEALNQLFAELPPLDEDDRSEFAQTVQAIRKGFPPEADPWA